MKTLEEIFEYYWPGFLTYKELINSHLRFKPKEIRPIDFVQALKEAYELGKSSKKCKEDSDNPYHIDSKRQTKIDF